MIDKKCVYIVSGYMRSGTSMMMKSLNAGGLTAVFSNYKDDYLNKKYARSGYEPNPEGFYELGPKEFEAKDFPLIYSGQLIKLLHWRLEALPEYNYRIIFMERDPVEIEVSYLKMFQRRPPFVLHKYKELINGIYRKLDDRQDIDYVQVQHRDMLTKPLETLSMLRDNEWPIDDIEAAAGTVNQALYRSKKGDLEKVREEIPGLRTDLPQILKEKKSER